MAIMIRVGRLMVKIAALLARNLEASYTSRRGNDNGKRVAAEPSSKTTIPLSR